MDRLNRMLQAAQGMGMGGAAPGGVSLSITSPVSPCAYLPQLRAGAGSMAHPRLASIRDLSSIKLDY